MVRVIPKHDHAGLLSWDEAIDTTRRALAESAERPDFDNPRQLVFSDSGTRVAGFQAVSEVFQAAGSNTHAASKPVGTDNDGLRGWGDHDENSRRGMAVHVLYENDSGDLLAVFIGAFVAPDIPTGTNGFRTTAIGAVGLEKLVKEDDTDVAVFGSGATAQNQLIALTHVADVESATVYSPTKGHREIFASEMPHIIDLEIEAVSSPEENVEGADIILCCTDSGTAVFDGEWLVPGQTVYSLGPYNAINTLRDREEHEIDTSKPDRAEIDYETLERADLIVSHHSVANEPWHEDPVTNWEETVHVRDLAAGKHPGRTNSDDIVVYNNDCGISIVDIALSKAMFDKAIEKGVGTEIPIYQPYIPGTDFVARNHPINDRTRHL